MAYVPSITGSWQQSAFGLGNPTQLFVPQTKPSAHSSSVSQSPSPSPQGSSTVQQCLLYPSQVVGLHFGLLAINSKSLYYTKNVCSVKNNVCKNLPEGQSPA